MVWRGHEASVVVIVMVGFLARSFDGERCLSCACRKVSSYVIR